MNSLYIKVGSITNAQRAMQLLKKNGFKSKISRAQNPADREGCGYIVIVNDDSDTPLKILAENGIEIRGVEEK